MQDYNESLKLLGGVLLPFNPFLLNNRTPLNTIIEGDFRQNS